ncbi:hypothetical protein AgCh_016244 [Apium graveolens]
MFGPSINQTSHPETSQEPPQESQPSIKALPMIVNLENEELKGDNKEEENCEQTGKKATSVAWDYFNRIPGLPVGKEKAKWNSTYTMLEVAIKYEGAFIRMIHEDTDYDAFFKVDNVELISENSKKKKKKVVERAPLFDDFDNVKRFIRFLEIFYDVTMKLSGSKYCTSNVFFVELVKVQEAIINLCSSEDILMRDMAKRMKDKYDKYWDNEDNTNFLLYVAVVLDPRKCEGFDILGWWKNNSTRLPILSQIAKHVLGMLVSSVASEAAFSTSGRMIDAYQSSLSSKTVEALICSRDWLRSSNNVTDIRGEQEEYLQHKQLENDELKVVGKLFDHLGIDD